MGPGQAVQDQDDGQAHRHQDAGHQTGDQHRGGGDQADIGRSRPGAKYPEEFQRAQQPDARHDDDGRQRYHRHVFENTGEVE